MNNTINQRFCTKCGIPNNPNSSYCIVCGAPLVQQPNQEAANCGVNKAENSCCDNNSLVVMQNNEQHLELSRIVKQPTEKKHSSGMKSGALLRVLKTAMLVFVVLVLLSGLSLALVRGLVGSKKLTIRSGEATTSSDKNLSVALVYDTEALNFKNNDSATLKIVLKNESTGVLRDVSAKYQLPPKLAQNGGTMELKADMLAPGMSREYELQVKKGDVLALNMKAVIIILAVTAVVTALLVYLYALICKRSYAAVSKVTALMLALLMLLPSFASVGYAAKKKGETTVIYDESGERIICFAHEHSVDDSISLGKGAMSDFYFEAEYLLEESLYMDAAVNETDEMLDLSWNAISGATLYQVYSSNGSEDFFELDSTDSTSCQTQLPTRSSVSLYRVVATTENGDLYSKDMRVIVQEDNRIYVDSDSDMLSNELEAVFLTSTSVKDTDGDGISDFDECTITHTNPTLYDSDANGVSDGDEDNDNDGLSSVAEIAAKTDPFAADTDDDGLSDYEELNATVPSDPTLFDTDDDGISDGNEKVLGTNPTLSDSDADGNNDAGASYNISIGASDNADISAQLSDTGYALTVADVYDITEESTFSNKEYIASPVIAIEVAESTTGSVTLPITHTASEAATNEQAATEEIAVAVYNPENNDFCILTDSVVSEDGASVTASFSDEYYMELEKESDSGSAVSTKKMIYCALFVSNWHIQFDVPLSPERNEDVELFFDVEFVIDESGSMEDGSKSTPNDPERYRVLAAKNFTYGLIEGDRAAVVGFADAARRKSYLSTDMIATRSAIDSIVGNAGGTALYSGLNEAITELLSAYDANRGRFIIALTDGEDNDSADAEYDKIISQCVEWGIPIFTIGLGSSVNTNLLAKLATYTKGAYFHIQSADDLPVVFNRIENTAFYGDDTDGDGLADKVEEYGLRDGVGNVYKTDATMRFTDDDDLSDGEEAGNVMYTEIGEDGETIEYYIMLTDPTKADTDGDGLDDLDELSMGTLPWCADTDNDGLSDGLEISIGYNPFYANYDDDTFSDAEEYQSYNYLPLLIEKMDPMGFSSLDELMLFVLSALPCCNDPYTYDLNTAEKCGAFLTGALLGDFGEILVESGLMNTELYDSIYYSLGQIALSLIPAANIATSVRDAVANVITGDIASAALNLTGAIPVAGQAGKVIGVLSSVLDKLYSGYQYTYEFSQKATIGDIAAMPSFVFILLSLIKVVESTLGIEMNTESLDNLVNNQIKNGTTGITKHNLRNWETYLNYSNAMPLRASGIADSIQKIDVSVSNTATHVELNAAARAALSNKAGGTVTEGVYTLVRTIDLECSEYQNAVTLEAALIDSVDRVFGYSDINYPELGKKLQIVMTDALISERMQSAFRDFESYANDKNVYVEYIIYVTTDDSQYGVNNMNIDPSALKNAIIFVPGMTGSELIANESYSDYETDYVIQKGDLIWLPEITPDLTVVTRALQAFKMLRMNSDGQSIYSVKPRPVTAEDDYCGTMGFCTDIYKALVSTFGSTHDVVFFSFDWRLSVDNSAKKLETYINLRQYDSVTLVCHSMGGIVASCYLANSESNVAKTARVITIGTPYGGSPKAYNAIEQGRFLDFSVFNQRIDLLDPIVKELTKNVYPIYELLPYDATIDSNSMGHGYIFDRSANRYLSASETKSLFMGNKETMNPQMLGNASSVQEKLLVDGHHIMNRADIDSYIIAGYNTPTITQLNIQDGKIVEEIKSNEGDGTVPLFCSTEFAGKAFNKPTYMVNGVDHTAMLADADVIALVCGIITDGASATYNSSKITARTSSSTIPTNALSGNTSKYAKLAVTTEMPVTAGDESEATAMPAPTETADVQGNASETAAASPVTSSGKGSSFDIRVLILFGVGLIMVASTCLSLLIISKKYRIKPEETNNTQFVEEDFLQ